MLLPLPTAERLAQLLPVADITCLSISTLALPPLLQLLHMLGLPAAWLALLTDVAEEAQVGRWLALPLLLPGLTVSPGPRSRLSVGWL